MGYWIIEFDHDYDYPEDIDVIDAVGPYESDEELEYDNEFTYCVLAESYDEAVKKAREEYDDMRLTEPDGLLF